jgi:hypothetical protein
MSFSLSKGLRHSILSESTPRFCLQFDFPFKIFLTQSIIYLFETNVSNKRCFFLDLMQNPLILKGEKRQKGFLFAFFLKRFTKNLGLPGHRNGDSREHYSCLIIVFPFSFFFQFFLFCLKKLLLYNCCAKS